jgi:lipopolysaccharide/colanic/teichoic acid biosynthesis glycosyltransferase
MKTTNVREQANFTRGDDLTPPPIPSYCRVKWYVDVIISILTLPILGTVLFLFMFLTWLTSKGPIIYTQVRCGKDGKPFKMYKIRSMYIDADVRSGPVPPGEPDPRVTPIGKIMRRLHIDELTQIVNVWRGEMTVIGPRPARPEEIEVFKREIPAYEYRMLVLPGMTGYAQLNCPADWEVRGVRKKTILDLEYIERLSFWFDMRILLATAFKLVRIGSKRLDNVPLRMCGMCRDPQESPWADRIGCEEFDESTIILAPRDTGVVLSEEQR